MITRQTSLSKNIVRFCIFLRQRNFNVGVEEQAAALSALEYVNYNDPIIFLLALKSILCRSKTQLDEFDKLFYEYWRELENAVNAKVKDDIRSKNNHRQEPSFKSLKSWLHGNKSDEIEETATYSLQESLSQKDFSLVPGDEVNELLQIVKALSKRLAAKAKRRYKFSNKIDLPDLRHTLRKNMRYGGELLHIVHRRPKRNRVKLVVLCDVSKSMELYAVFLLQFMYAFQQVYKRMETFIFSTSLKRISPLLNHKDFREALHSLSSEKSGWAGGTRIGESLTSFVKDYSKKIIDSKTIVIILSDGWDTGNIDSVKKSMEAIHKSARKVIWLNPSAGYKLYRPEVA
ncbi:MAG: VWA domain-containing protein, partial [Ginsengibacter sp.]